MKSIGRTYRAWSELSEIAVSGHGDGSGAASVYRARVSEAELRSADDGARSRLRLIVLESEKALPSSEYTLRLFSLSLNMPTLSNDCQKQYIACVVPQLCS